MWKLLKPMFIDIKVSASEIKTEDYLKSMENSIFQFSVQSDFHPVKPGLAAEHVFLV